MYLLSTLINFLITFELVREYIDKDKNSIEIFAYIMFKRFVTKMDNNIGIIFYWYCTLETRY